MKKITLSLIAIAGTLGLSSCTAKKAMNKKMCCDERKIEIATCFAGHGHSDSNAHYAEYGLTLILWINPFAHKIISTIM